MASVDPDWDLMLTIAKSQQQEFYELLPEWTRYEKSEYKYLKQNIGFALFGPPSELESNFTVHANDTTVDSTDILDKFCYKPDAQKIIDAIFNKVCEFAEGLVYTRSTYYGVMFNVTFRTRNSSSATSSSEAGSKNKKPKVDKDKKDKKTEVDKDEKDKKAEVDKDEQSNINIQQMPIFKIKRATGTVTEIWYIDMYERVYKSWTDYKENNVLPPCTMVLPKDGLYQPDPGHEITDVSSDVWLEIVDSPSSSTLSSVLRSADTASSIIGIAGLGVGIASMFTPIGPVVLGASAAAAGINGIWTIGRSAQNLMDKKSHEESLTDRAAICSWLAITGGTVGIAATGGTTILTRAVQNGAHINRAARLAYNSLVLSNLGVNGIGIAYQAYCIYQRYQEGQEISTVDVLSLGTHILFFGNAVVNLQFAGELIESTQGRVLDDYRNSIRSKRLRKQFNRTKRTAAANNTDQASENAEVIRYINGKRDLQIKLGTGNVNVRSPMSFENGKIILDGIVLLDPMKFVITLLTLDQRNKNNTREGGVSSVDENNCTDMFYMLKDLVINLIMNLYSSNDNAHIPDIDEFDNVLHDMKSMDNAAHIFSLIFEMSIILVQRSTFDLQYLVRAVHFFWYYIKENLRHVCLNLSSSITNSRTQKTINTIIIAMFEYTDDIIERFLPAFTQYMTEHIRLS
ncbi:uncharacterized protein LOC143375079 isoform X1 [Andrena cerasifolii]|uniref:uncharacterized protein LOC143375079 isoform X1 n=2 Tax=Andrena cerasifolii TaxID=2819439 RepID=UPI0040380CB8